MKSPPSALLPPKMARGFRTQNLSLVILGAVGDLAKKKTYPALCTLMCQGFLPTSITIIGYSRIVMTQDEFHDFLRPFLKQSPDEIEMFLDRCTYLSTGDSDWVDSPEMSEGFRQLSAHIDSCEELMGTAPSNRLFYYALPASIYPQVSVNVDRHCRAKRGGWTRVILEKPFGHDSESAEELATQIGGLFSEEEVYRIDHYLGKEIVQNMMVMRFANRFLTPIWNRDNIANVQIIFKEPHGVDGRGAYFDKYGIIRDIIQNHLVQVMALVAMEKPSSLNPEDIRDEKLKLLKSIKPVKVQDAAIGQYVANSRGDPGYKDDPSVSPTSRTETFAMCVLYVNNERWDGVPFILKAGKALNERKTEVRVQLRDVPGDIFKGSDVGMRGRQGRNEFVIRVQPDEAIYMKMTVKDPGLEMAIHQSELELVYEKRYATAPIPEAYERLILDCLNGDQQHFIRRDELRAAWSIFTPLLHYFEAAGIQPEPYAYGSRGPVSADSLRANTGHVTSCVRCEQLGAGLLCDYHARQQTDNLAPDGLYTKTPYCNPQPGSP